MCPLNEKFWPGLPDSIDRLKLYVPRTIKRWFSFDGAENRLCEGKVTGVSSEKKIKIVYEDGDEYVDEKTFLDVVKVTPIPPPNPDPNPNP